MMNELMNTDGDELNIPFNIDDDNSIDDEGIGGHNFTNIDKNFYDIRSRNCNGSSLHQRNIHNLSDLNNRNSNGSGGDTMDGENRHHKCVADCDNYEEYSRIAPSVLNELTDTLTQLTSVIFDCWTQYEYFENIR